MTLSFLELPLWGLVLITLVLTHITIVSVTIFLHRHQAHRALELHPIASHFFRFWLWLTTGMVTREWVAVHRRHHAKCETPEDPHSPRWFGIRKVLLQGAELYRAGAADLAAVETYGAGTPNDWLERRIYSAHPTVGIALMLLIDMALFGPLGITVWAVQMLWIPFWAAGVVNGLGHYAGYRNFETEDASTNLAPWGFLIGGEELHNNHHAYPASAKLSCQWWEFDIGWFYIRILSLLGLAQVRNVAPRVRFRPTRTEIDSETLGHLIRNRVHVLSWYGRKVILPVLRQEYRFAAKPDRWLLRKAKSLMLREGLPADAGARQFLEQVFGKSHALETVYGFKERLKELWLKTHWDTEGRLQALRGWCRDAEQTGIESLRLFAERLRTYTVQHA
jgi:stearoyl-CoA desaturase (delta-9 desaturase)